MVLPAFKPRLDTEAPDRFGAVVGWIRAVPKKTLLWHLEGKSKANVVTKVWIPGGCMQVGFRLE